MWADRSQDKDIGRDCTTSWPLEEPMCAQADVRATFDRLASEYDELKLRVIPGYRQVQDLVLRYARGHPRERVLELGCGTGEWASAFLRSHPAVRYVAVEFSPKMREICVNPPILPWKPLPLSRPRSERRTARWTVRPGCLILRAPSRPQQTTPRRERVRLPGVRWLVPLRGHHGHAGSGTRAFVSGRVGRLHAGSGARP